MAHKAPICLIVDDEPDTCWALQHVLKKLGVRSRLVSRAAQALQEIHEVRYTLALLDAKLPDQDGLELARSIRDMRPDIPIIIVSGYFYADDPAIQEALSEGRIQGFVSKPFLHPEIVRAVSKALDGSTDSRDQGNGSRE